MMTGGTCTKQILVSTHEFCIERCSCGIILIHTGAVTLRMPVEEAENFTTVLAKAMVINRELLKKTEPRTLRVVRNDDCGTAMPHGNAP